MQINWWDAHSMETIFICYCILYKFLGVIYTCKQKILNRFRLIVSQLSEHQSSAHNSTRGALSCMCVCALSGFSFHLLCKKECDPFKGLAQENVQIRLQIHRGPSLLGREHFLCALCPKKCIERAHLCGFFFKVSSIHRRYVCVCFYVVLVCVCVWTCAVERI